LFLIATGDQQLSAMIGSNLGLHLSLLLFGFEFGWGEAKVKPWVRVARQVGFFAFFTTLGIATGACAMMEGLLKIGLIAITLFVGAKFGKSIVRKKRNARPQHEGRRKSVWRSILSHVIAITLGLTIMIGCRHLSVVAGSAAQRSLYNQKPAPATVFTDSEDLPWTLQDHEGKVILVEFWAPYCAPCIASIPHLKSIQQSYGGRNDFLMVSVTAGGSHQRAVELFERNELDWTLLFQPEESSDNDLRPYFIPAAYVINRQGEIVASHIRGEEIDDVLHDLLESND